MRIEELLIRFPTSCTPDDTLDEAAQKMEDSACACLPISAGGGSPRLLGMITDCDICMAAKLHGRSPEELRVRDAMAAEVRVMAASRLGRSCRQRASVASSSPMTRRGSSTCSHWSMARATQGARATSTVPRAIMAVLASTAPGMHQPHPLASHSRAGRADSAAEPSPEMPAAAR